MILYDKTKLEKLKLKFNNVETIDVNYSQAYQDMFVLTMLDGKQKGTYLEIGAFNPTFISNTCLLDKKFGWTGISIDIDAGVGQQFIGTRNCTFVLQNALTIDYKKLLENNNMPKQIDYLQLDIEPQANTLSCLKMLPLDEYRFSVITYETDFYDPGVTREVSMENREESRQILISHGYEMVVGNLCNVSTTDPFEDWYVDPKVVSPELIQKLKQSMEYNNTSESFMLNL